MLIIAYFYKANMGVMVVEVDQHLLINTHVHNTEFNPGIEFIPGVKLLLDAINHAKSREAKLPTEE